MAKKKKQRTPINPDLATVKSVFQTNVDVARKVQRMHKSNLVERYDLADVYCKRRIKAVMNLLPEFKERYEYTGAVLPRDMHRFDDLKKELRARGLKPSQANTLCAMMNIIGEVSRQRFDFSKYADQDDWEGDWNFEEEDAGDDLEAENEKLKAELTKMRKQAKEANYNLSRQNRELKDQLEKASETMGEMRQELADLRDVVFNQQNMVEEEKAEESKITFPYHTTRRIVAFGGHDSWLREIKFKLPDVRFMSDDISSPEIIKRADVVWIQTNCIGHKSYYTIIDLARKYGRKVRYFAYASATKCAEQVVEEENTDK